MSPGWGWTPPSGGGTPPVSLNPADGLQDVVDAIAAAGGGGKIQLGAGTYYADPASPSTPLTIPAGAYGMSLLGLSNAVSIIGSPILCQTLCRFEDFHLDPGATAYGLKIKAATFAFLARCNLNRLIIGRRNQVASQGPTNGLHLDGAGLISAYACTFAFNAGAGVYSDTTDPTGAASTNVNIFHNCTLNGNGRYGYEGVTGTDGVSSQLGNAFLYGNIESNGAILGATGGAVLATGQNNLSFVGVDFENGTSVDNLIQIATCNPVQVENCNFVSSPGKAVRVGIFSSCDQVRFVGNRMVGFVDDAVPGYTDERTLIFNETSSRIVCYGNVLADGPSRYILNRSAM